MPKRYGGAVAVSGAESTAVVKATLFESNTATDTLPYGFGGALSIRDSAEVTLAGGGNTFKENSARQGASISMTDPPTKLLFDGCSPGTYRASADYILPRPLLQEHEQKQGNGQ